MIFFYKTLENSYRRFNFSHTNFTVDKDFALTKTLSFDINGKVYKKIRGRVEVLFVLTCNLSFPTFPG